MGVGRSKINDLVWKALAAYDIRHVGDIDSALPKLMEAGDLQGCLMLQLAQEAYAEECAKRVHMIIEVHPKDRALIQSEADLRNTSVSDLMVMATLSRFIKNDGEARGPVHDQSRVEHRN